MALSSIQPSFVTPSLAIEGGLQYGYVITIKGTVLNSNGTRFAVNFKTGPSDSEIAFHFNPRFEEGGYVVCNTRQKGWWGTEERMRMNPFRMGKPFEISILVDSARFQVVVNGAAFLQYIHRVPFHRVDNISVTGAVGLTHISFQDTRAVCLQRMMSEVQSYPSLRDSPESKEWKPKPPSYWQATMAPIMQKVIPGLKCPVSLPAPVSTQPRSLLLVQVSWEPWSSWSCLWRG
ncbi:galectin-9-like isoform X4 [Myotis daubentonii]|uniref:galectin-9-like isoform X4 n=1 Tax=Myotis daubentonii TaxID=98922 RepID=UPI0028738B4B|nr:galectin-9-like isoform X4 [Myotis daubentonii]